eukprot:scaffold49508_cov67-Phaeocystis_antarctica.AAC.1
MLQLVLRLLRLRLLVLLLPPRGAVGSHPHSHRQPEASARQNELGRAAHGRGSARRQRRQLAQCVGALEGEQVQQDRLPRLLPHSRGRAVAQPEAGWPLCTSIDVEFAAPPASDQVGALVVTEPPHGSAACGASAQPEPPSYRLASEKRRHTILGRAPPLVEHLVGRRCEHTRRVSAEAPQPADGGDVTHEHEDTRRVERRIEWADDVRTAQQRWRQQAAQVAEHDILLHLALKGLAPHGLEVVDLGGADAVGQHPIRAERAQPHAHRALQPAQQRLERPRVMLHVGRQHADIGWRLLGEQQEGDCRVGGESPQQQRRPRRPSAPAAHEDAHARCIGAAVPALVAWAGAAALRVIAGLSEAVVRRTALPASQAALAELGNAGSGAPRREPGARSNSDALYSVHVSCRFHVRLPDVRGVDCPILHASRSLAPSWRSSAPASASDRV